MSYFCLTEDGRDQRPKHVELIGIINKPLFLHLVGVYIIYINYARSNKYQIYKMLFTRDTELIAPLTKGTEKRATY